MIHDDVCLAAAGGKECKVFMSKILVVSDSHLNNEVLSRVTDRWQTLSLKFHCGDSNLLPDDPLLSEFLVVRGNDDGMHFPSFLVHGPFLVTHGHLEHVYVTDGELIALARKHQCTTVFHGHTHVPRNVFVDDIHIINPGSLLINRGSYGFGTYALFDTDTQEVTFHHYETDDVVNDVVLPDGQKILAEFRQILRGD